MVEGIKLDGVYEDKLIRDSSLEAAGSSFCLFTSLRSGEIFGVVALPGIYRGKVGLFGWIIFE